MIVCGNWALKDGTTGDFLSLARFEGFRRSHLSKQGAFGCCGCPGRCGRYQALTFDGPVVSCKIK